MDTLHVKTRGNKNRQLDILGLLCGGIPIQVSATSPPPNDVLPYLSIHCFSPSFLGIDLLVLLSLSPKIFLGLSWEGGAWQHVGGEALEGGIGCHVQRLPLVAVEPCGQRGRVGSQPTGSRIQRQDPINSFGLFTAFGWFWFGKSWEGSLAREFFAPPIFSFAA